MQERARRALVPGLYAWGTTVLPLAIGGTGAVATRLVLRRALVGLPILFLLVPLAWSMRSNKERAAVSILGFLGACGANWVVWSAALQSPHLSPWRGEFGALGFVLYVYAWGGALPKSHAADPVDRGPPSPDVFAEARGSAVAGVSVRPSSLPPPGVGLARPTSLRAPPLLLAGCALAAVICGHFAWSETDAPRALVAQTSASLICLGSCAAFERLFASVVSRAEGGPRLSLLRALAPPLVFLMAVATYLALR